jgi:hypothetical protein
MKSIDRVKENHILARCFDRRTGLEVELSREEGFVETMVR